MKKNKLLSSNFIRQSICIFILSQS